MTQSRIERRALAAIRFVDATTGAAIRDRLHVSAPDTTFVRNLSGAYAITAAPGFGDYIDEFAQPPIAPPLESVEVVITVRDPGRRYLPRQTRLRLPRDPDPSHEGQPGSLFTIPLVDLFPAPIAPKHPGTAMVRVSARDSQSGAGLPFTYFRLRRASAGPTDPPLARGIADERGEALVAVAGIEVTSWEPPATPPDDDDPTPVVSYTIDVVLEAYFDPDAGVPPDPDLIDSNRATLPRTTQAFALASGSEVAVRVEIDAA